MQLEEVTVRINALNLVEHTEPGNHGQRTRAAGCWMSNITHWFFNKTGVVPCGVDFECFQLMDRQKRPALSLGLDLTRIDIGMLGDLICSRELIV